MAAKSTLKQLSNKRAETLIRQAWQDDAKVKWGEVVFAALMRLPHTTLHDAEFSLQSLTLEDLIKGMQACLAKEQAAGRPALAIAFSGNTGMTQ